MKSQKRVFEDIENWKLKIFNLQLSIPPLALAPAGPADYSGTDILFLLTYQCPLLARAGGDNAL
jgi:hypothetical protein